MLWFLAACSSSPGPSVLWISLDTVRADHLGLYGGRAETPNLDALATNAIVYTRAYSHFPETGPSHWSLMTGVLPEVHGDLQTTGDSAWTGPTAAEIAKAKGYATGAFIGGITLTNEATGLSRGFDVYDDTFVPVAGDLKRRPSETIAAALAWRVKQSAPTFTFVHFFDAHFPYTPEDGTRYDPDYTGALDGSDAALRPYRDFNAPISVADLEHCTALYDAELTELDAALAPLLAAVDDQTIVVVTGDHGESFEHGYLFNHRGALTEGTLHVPFVLRAPGRTPARNDALVGLVDVLPTLAEAAGWTVPGPIHGQSMLTATEGRKAVWSRTDPLRGKGVPDGPLIALTTPGWRVVWTGTGHNRAYQIATDRAESHPVQAPIDLLDQRGDYEALLTKVRARVTTRPAKRQVGSPEAEQLKSLGYLAPEPPGASPGAAPR